MTFAVSATEGSGGSGDCVAGWGGGGGGACCCCCSCGVALVAFGCTGIEMGIGIAGTTPADFVVG